MLTTLALVYFPLLPPNTPRAVAPSALSPVDHVSMREKQQTRTVDTGEKLNYVVMDRAGPSLDEPEMYVLSPAYKADRISANESLAKAVLFASIAICMRPTTVAFWAFLGAEYLLRMRGNRNPVRVLRDLIKGALTAYVS